MVVSSHEKPDCALLDCSILGVHGLSRRCGSHYVEERERDREAARRGTEDLLLLLLLLLSSVQRGLAAYTGS